jgi:hypothetical protein
MKPGKNIDQKKKYGYSCKQIFVMPDLGFTTIG